MNMKITTSLHDFRSRGSVAALSIMIVKLIPHSISSIARAFLNFYVTTQNILAFALLSWWNLPQKPDGLSLVQSWSIFGYKIFTSPLLFYFFFFNFILAICDNSRSLKKTLINSIYLFRCGSISLSDLFPHSLTRDTQLVTSHMIDHIICSMDVF